MTCVPEANILAVDKEIHPIVYRMMQLFIHTLGYTSRHISRTLAGDLSVNSSWGWVLNKNHVLWGAVWVGIHYDVIKWKHFPRYWLCVRGIHWSPVNSQRPATRSFDISFDLRLNKRVSKQWWGHCAHYNVIVMCVKHHQTQIIDTTRRYLAMKHCL